MSNANTCVYCHLPIPPALIGSRHADHEPLYCCYGCRLADMITSSRDDSHAHRQVLTRLGLGIVLAMLVMGFSLPLYSGDVYGAHDQSGVFVSELIGFLRYASMLLTTISFVLLGWPILANAVDRAREGSLNSDLFILVGVGAAIVYSGVSTIRNSGGAYFETTCMVLVLFTLGRYLEAIGKARSTRAIQSLNATLPSVVEVTRHGSKLVVAAEGVEVGDLVHVPAGQVIPIDGTVESGRAQLNVQIVTGESAPVEKGVGDSVLAGSLNLDGLLQIKAQSVGAASTIGRLKSLIDQARLSKGMYQRAAERAVAYFLPCVFVLAIATAVLHLMFGSVESAILSSLAVLLISCPCALGIATPAAVWIAIGRAARSGVLFKGGASLEALAGIRAVAFDKTGTLSSKDMEVAPFFNGHADTTRSREWMSIAAGLAESTRHVYSDSILRHARDREIEPAVLTEVRTVPGAGVKGVAQGKQVYLGSVTSMADSSAAWEEAMIQEAARIRDAAEGLSCLTVDGSVRALFSFRDELRPEASKAVRELRNLGCEVQLLTGDHLQRADAIARQLDIPFHAALTPHDKVEAIAHLRRTHGTVAMVGDGLNDAPALAGADVGVAMGCGVDLARDTSDVCLVGDQLTYLPWAIRLARKTMRTIRFNLFWAFSFNAVGIPLAMMGKLNPVFAAIAMVVGSLTVVANARRLESFDAEPA